MNQIFTVVGLIQADVIGAAERFVGKKRAAHRVGNEVAPILLVLTAPEELGI